jgi:hypothetical protein
MWKTLIMTALGLLLLTGSSSAKKRIEFTPNTNANRDVPREYKTAPTAQQRFNNQSPQEAVHVHGLLQVSGQGRQVEVAGQKVILSPNCSFFPPNVHSKRNPDLQSWNGKRVTVFGYASRTGIDARLIILSETTKNEYPRAADESLRTIPSTSDPTVGVSRRGVPQ